MHWKFWRALPNLAVKARLGAGVRRLGAALGLRGTGGAIGRLVVGLVAAYLLGCIFLGWWWDKEPAVFDVRANAASHAQQAQRELVIGYATTATLVRLAESLLDKRGGYLSNDLMPPALWMDNIPNWEFRGADANPRRLPRLPHRFRPLAKPIRRRPGPAKRRRPVLLRQLQLDLPGQRRGVPAGASATSTPT